LIISYICVQGIKEHAPQELPEDIIGRGEQIER
jgi:hypothetical protein